MIKFTDAVRLGFRRYVDFEGRSTRAEYWWWVLFSFLSSMVLGVADTLMMPGSDAAPMTALFVLVTLLPAIAVTVRRLHDINRTGWWILISVIPLIGPLVLLIWMCKKSDETPNRFGPPQIHLVETR